MVNLENYYAKLERTIKPTRYVKDTCPRVYDTWTCNRLRYQNQSNLSGVVTSLPQYCHYAEVFVTRPMMDMAY
jgi:hypothetical protein